MAMAVNSIKDSASAKKALEKVYLKVHRYYTSSIIHRTVAEIKMFFGGYFDENDRRGGDALRFAIINRDQSLLPVLKEFQAQCPGYPFSITAYLASFFIENGTSEFMKLFATTKEYDPRKYFGNWSGVFDEAIKYYTFPGLEGAIKGLLPSLKGHHAISAELLLEDIEKAEKSLEEG